MNELDREHLRKLRALPVEGLPPVEARPTCLYCHKRLEPEIRNVWSARDGLTGRSATASGYPEVERRVFEGYKGYGRLDQADGSGMFCRLNCAYHFARAAVRAGYRIKTTAGR